MFSSLEARSPLLDHRVVEFAWQLVPELKAGSRALKYLLRQTLFDFVPRDLVDLPKQGFSVPLGTWMRAQLRPFVEDLLDHSRVHLADVIQPAVVDRAWQDHLRGRAGQTEKVWSVVMFSQWSRRWMTGFA
jgi:asparagine synthase (glutamine-hydrolysing)